MTQRCSGFLILMIMLSPLLNLTQAQHVSIPDLFENIDSQPEIITIPNELDVNNRGGHLQGIQLFFYKGVEYIVLTGSSGILRGTTPATARAIARI